MSDAKKLKDAITHAAMFFAGLILLIPHRIGMSRVNYVIKRYNLPISRAGLILYKYHNNIELSLTIGTLFGNIINWSFFAFASSTVTWYVKNILSKSDKTTELRARDREHIKRVISYFIFFFLFLMLLSSIYMYRIYVSGGDFGHLNSFYFSLIFLSLFDGFANAHAFALNGKQSSMLAAGIPLSGFLVTLLHYIYKFFSDLYHWDDFDYNVLRIQLLCNNIIIFITLIIWTVDQSIDIYLIMKHFHKYDDQGATNNCGKDTEFSNLWSANDNIYKWQDSNNKPCPHRLGQYNSLLELFNHGASDTEHAGDWSPILLLAISLGTVYAFYPSIAPYSIIDYQYASVIELWILVISALIPFTFAMLDFLSDMLGTADRASNPYWMGPSGLNITTGKNFSWDPNSGKLYWLWHLVWLCAIPYILCIQIFMSMLHYPDCLLSSLFNNNPYLIVFISILFNTLRELMQACGFAGAGKQQGNPPVEGGIASLNKLITLFVMMFCVFTGDGYLQHYRRCCRDCWPTTGYTKYQSFFYWLHFGFKGGIKSITSSFTDLYYHNLRPQFISYA